MLFRSFALLILLTSVLLSNCRAATSETEIRHDVKYLALYSSPGLVTQEDDKRLTTNFQSNYKSRVVLLRPVSIQAWLPQSQARVSLLAMIKINSLREARAIAAEIQAALGGTLITLMPVIETPGSQESFSGHTFYLGFEKRSNAFVKLSGLGKSDVFRNEADDLARDRNMLSYFSGSILSDTPYNSVHILGYSGITETQFETLEGIFYRGVRKIDGADTLIAEKIR
jgi:hypothetical protein